MYSIVLILFSFCVDIEFLYFSLAPTFFHFLKGLGAIVNDYIYTKVVSIFFFFCVRVSILEILRYFIDFLF